MESLQTELIVMAAGRPHNNIVTLQGVLFEYQQHVISSVSLVHELPPLCSLFEFLHGDGQQLLFVISLKLLMMDGFCACFLILFIIEIHLCAGEPSSFNYNAVPWALQIADALGYLSDRLHIVHRDIRSHHILLFEGMCLRFQHE